MTDPAPTQPAKEAQTETEDEKIDRVAAEILKKYINAFKELAK